MTTETDSIRTLTTDKSMVLAQYVEKASRLSIVKEIMVAEEENGLDIWTIINAPPFEIEATEPLMGVFVKAFEKAGFPFDFQFLNIAEYSTEKEARQFTPRHARSLWRPSRNQNKQ